MSTEKHTQGPWRVRPDAGPWRATCDENGTSAYEAVFSGDEVIALVVARSTDAWGDAPPTEHNARLIAAAPQQYDALLAVKYSTGWAALDEATRNAVTAALKAVGAA